MQCQNRIAAAPSQARHGSARQVLSQLALSAGMAAGLFVAAPSARAQVAPASADAAAETTLPTVTITAAGERRPGDLPKPYPGGQVARGSRQGLLGNADVFETPFSTKSYTAELIQNQGARNVNDVVANDPSIRTSLSATGPLDQSSIRGFVSYGDAYLFDGVQGLAGYSSLSVQNFERLEVFKGPSGALVGAAAYGTGVGGGFNLVPKRATDAPVRSVTLSASDKSLAGVHVDLGQRFGVDNGFGLRLNLTAENGDQFNDAERKLVAPLLALDWRGEQVRVVLDAGTVRYTSTAAFTNRRLAPDATVPAVPDPRTNPNAAWETLELDQAFGLLSAEWDFVDGWTAYARHGRFHEEPSKRTYLNTSALDGAGGFTISGASSYLWKQDNAVSELGARGKAKWGSVTHQLAFSAVQDREEYHAERFYSEDFAGPIAGSIYTRPTIPDPFVNGVPATPGTDYPAVYLTSFAAADTVAMLGDKLLLTLALRRQSVKNDPYDQSRTTPTLAALVKLGNGISVYANYAESLAQGESAPDTAANAGEQLPPFVSRQHELGMKWDRGTYGLTAAYFDIRKAFAFVDAANVFRAGGQQQNKGIELETFGEPAKGLRVLGGVAWIDGRQTRTEGGATDGKKAIGVPEFTANLGAEVDVPALPGLTVTGRVIHTGDAYLDLTNTQRVADWNRLDFGARYRTRLAGQALTLRAGVENLFDRAYWTIGGRNFISVAPPRTWRLSATVAF